MNFFRLSSRRADINKSFCGICIALSICFFSIANLNAADFLNQVDSDVEIIIIEGEIFRVNPESGITVKLFQIFDFNGMNVFEDGACQSENCEYSYSVANPGQYVVRVVTSDNQIYTQGVYLQ